MTQPFQVFRPPNRARVSSGVLGRLARRSAAAARLTTYREVFEDSLDAMLILDPEGEIVVDANPAACALYGCSRQELIGSSMLARSNAGAVGGVRSQMLEAGLEPGRFCAIHYRADRSAIWLEINATPIRYRGRRLVLTVNRDVSEKAVTSKRITNAAAEWQLTVDSIEEAILLVDLSGSIVRSNLMVAEIAGVPPTQMPRLHLSSVGPGEPWARAAEMVAYAGEHGAGISSHVDDPVSGATWEIAVSPAVSPAGDQRVIVVARDITAMVALEDSLRRNESMAEMGQLVAGVAHEVRNPLFTISANLDAFEKRVLADGAAPDTFLHNLREAISRLSTLMHDLLELGKPSLVKPAGKPLALAVKDAVSDIARLASERNVTVVNEVTEEIGHVFMDRRKLGQAIHNVLANAIFHSPPASSVLISAQRVARHGQSWINCAVEDAGPGFLEGDLRRVFEPFFTKRKGGTGLGLSIVQRIVEHHGGRVFAENRADGGARVAIMLPRLTEEDDDTTQSSDR